MKWRYSLRWKLPHKPCPGLLELVSVVVEAGQAAPEEVMARWVAGSGYAVCVDFSVRNRSSAGAMNGKPQ
jgi:2-keto-4-pentenoate hydratase/2-oxohepta-3-ene-1,7-dioic acid hydratase in catechol pathway